VYAVIRRYPVQPHLHDAVIKAVTEGLAPKIASSPGFVAYRAGFTDNGDALSISIFDTAEQADASSAAALDWVRQTLGPMLPVAPTIWRGELRVRGTGAAPVDFGVLRRYNVDAANVDEIVRRAEAGFLPLISGAPGFSRYALMDAGAGQVITLSGFSDRTSAEASVALAADWVKANLASLVSHPPEVTRVELAVSLAST
jgi:hypothetical protein